VSWSCRATYCRRNSSRVASADASWRGGRGCQRPVVSPVSDADSEACVPIAQAVQRADLRAAGGVPPSGAGGSSSGADPPSGRRRSDLGREGTHPAPESGTSPAPLGL
jgi:hypothetical protein